ncbi:MAG: hypothetical protein Q4B65_00700, partial [Candidatus Saccharibacteria bacterium]|nr:hypothetical protein [Candidatus Saccharibacteria bacterium]
MLGFIGSLAHAMLIAYVALTIFSLLGNNCRLFKKVRIKEGSRRKKFSAALLEQEDIITAVAIGLI